MIVLPDEITEPDGTKVILAPPTVSLPKKPKSIEKAQKALKKLQKRGKKEKSQLNHDKHRERTYARRAKKDKSKRARARNRRLAKKWGKARKSKQRQYNRTSDLIKRAKDKASRLAKGYQTQVNLVHIAEAVQEHNAAWQNEGHAAIYPSDGGTGANAGAGSIIYISPSSSESGTTQSNITSYAVDKGAPRSNYARESSRTVSVNGIITGRTRAEAKAKYNQLQQWQDNNVELTYQGDIYYTHLLINNLQQSYSTYRDNIAVSISFTFVYPANITVSTGKHNKKKSSKGKKTTRGNRHKRYTTITVKWGMTLWGLSKRYHTSVRWLAKVNHIRNPNRIYVGRKLRVR